MGVTLGSPIALIVPNKDQKPEDYSEINLFPRPSHADWTFLEKYGLKVFLVKQRRVAEEEGHRLEKL